LVNDILCSTCVCMPADDMTAGNDVLLPAETSTFNQLLTISWLFQNKSKETFPF
jgi:hypothetical protein